MAEILRFPARSTNSRRKLSEHDEFRDDVESGSVSPSTDANEPDTRAVASEPEPLWRHLLGGLLRRRRQERKETLADTARRAGVSPQYLSEVERGVKDPSSEMIAAIAGALDLPLHELVRGVAAELRPAIPGPGQNVTSMSHGAYLLAA